MQPKQALNSLLLRMTLNFQSSSSSTDFLVTTPWLCSAGD